MDNSDFNHILWDCWYFLFLNVYVLLVGKLWYYVILRDFLNCRIVLDLQNYCKGSTESSLIPHAQIPLLSASSISRYICHSYGANIDTLLLNSILYSDFLSFFLKIFFFFLFQDLISLSKWYLLRLGCGISPDFPFSWWPWQCSDSCGSTGRVFCCVPLNRDVSDVFLMIRLGYRVLGRKTTGVKCHSGTHHIEGTYCQSDLTLLTLTLITCWNCTYFWFGNICTWYKIWNIQI